VCPASLGGAFLKISTYDHFDNIEIDIRIDSPEGNIKAKAGRSLNH
jgi:hypothetical protein